MTDLTGLWLRLPGVDPVDLDRHGISFRAAQMVGGVRQMGADWVLAAFIDPPSIWRDVDDPVIVDLVAFDPAEPSKWRTKYGDGVMLGEEAFREARIFRQPLPVFKTPMTWLQSGGAGVFVLDPLAFGIAMLGNDRLRLVPEDVGHGEEIERIIDRAARFGRPSIWIRRAA